MFALSLNFLDQALLFGDFFENSSETSIFGRKLTGIKYSGNYWDMGKGIKRLTFVLAGGESETPKDSGDNEINIYGQEVDTGFSIRVMERGPVL